jgi:hypothetical protein
VLGTTPHTFVAQIAACALADSAKAAA